MSVGAVSSSNLASYLLAARQQSLAQQQSSVTQTKDGDGDHGVEPTKGQHINLKA